MPYEKEVKLIEEQKRREEEIWRKEKKTIEAEERQRTPTVWKKQ